jgi:hypothetical protein
MLSPADITAIIGQPNNVSTLVNHNQSTDDIVNSIISQHRKNVPTYAKICKNWKYPKNTGIYQDLFNFCKKYMPYRAEPWTDQNILSPQVIAKRATNNENFDCKHYASFIGGMLQSFNEPFTYTFASDVPNNDYATHVFITTQDGTTIDPCFQTLDYPHTYYFKENIKPMALYEISGITDQTTDTGIGNIFDDLKKGVNVNLQNLKKGANISVENVKKGAQNTGDKAKRAALQKTLFFNRQAFLGLLKINFGLWAVKILERCNTQEGYNEWRNKWESLGGDWNAFKIAVNMGYKRYLFNRKRKMPPNLKYISGGDPLTAALALIAAATPIILAVTDLLKKSGANPNSRQPDVPDEPTGTGTTPEGIPTGATGKKRGLQLIQPSAENFDFNLTESAATTPAYLYNTRPTDQQITTAEQASQPNFFERNKTAIETGLGITAVVIAGKLILENLPKKKKR